MNCKNCLNKLMWLAGVLLVVSFVFPNGFEFGSAKPEPAAPTAPVATDSTIVTILADAAPEDRSRISGIYDALAFVLKRDGAKLITTTEQWALLQANTLQKAIETPGEYPDLDVAIEAVFARAIGTDDVVSVTPEVEQKLVTACETIANSAR
jgi:hypothetical protein